MSPPKQTSARDFKHHLLTCLNKLSDRDTHATASKELETIAKTLTHDTLPPFISSISVTNASDKSPVRKQCIHLISTLSASHGNDLSPYYTKLIAAVTRRLRDHDTTVRHACVEAVTSLAVHVTKPPFTSLVKPLVDVLVTEQDVNVQIGAALCLAAVISGSSNPDVVYLKRLLVRIERMLKNDGYNAKAKAALLSVVMSVIGVDCCDSLDVVRKLVSVMVDFVVKSEDWCLRKGAAEVLVKLAVCETELLVEVKSSCLKTFEVKKFDKVKSVRETMIQLIETWNEIPDMPEEEVSLQPSKAEEAADVGIAPQTPQTMNRRTAPYSSSTSTATERSSFENSSRKAGPAMFRKLDRKKPNDRKLDTAVVAPPATLVSKNEGNLRNRSVKQETKRVLFNEISEGKMHESQHIDERSSSRVEVSNVNSAINVVHQDPEDLSLIRNQLAKIESRQSNLFELLEKFIGNSQTGMRSLESRVLGLESTLDELSFDLAKSSGRVSSPQRTLCCKLPGADLLSSKFWKKAETRHTPIKNTNLESHNFQNSRYRLQGGGSGLIKNPLADVHQM